MAVLMAGTFVFVLDFFIVNVAIPSTQAELGASDAQIQLVVATYAIAVASLLILGGRLGDLFGRRRVFIAGLTLFTASSALCGAAPGIELLLVGRVVQGIGAALFAPQVLSIIGVTFDGERAAARRHHLRPDDGAGGGGRPADRRRADRARPLRPRLARLLPGQRADRDRRDRAGAPRASPSRGRRRGSGST